MDQTKRIIIMLAVVMGLLYVWPLIFPPPQKQKEKTEEQKTESPASSSPTGPTEMQAPAPEGGTPQPQPSPEGGTVQPQPQPQPAPPAPAPEGGTPQPQPPAEATPPAAAPPEETATEKEITIETKHLRAVFTSRGGALKSLEILPAEGKQYGINLIDFNDEAHKRLSLVVNTSEDGDPTGVDKIYSVSKEPTRTDPVVEFRTTWGEGEKRKTLIKTYDFSRREGDSPYAFRVTLRFLGAEAQPEKLKFTLIGGVGIKKADPFVPELEGHIVTPNKHDRFEIPAIFDETKTVSNEKIRLVAVTSKYFTIALIPITFEDQNGSASLAPVLTAKEGGVKDPKKNSVVTSLSYDATLSHAVGEAGYKSDSGPCEFIFYAGPLEEEKLQVLSSHGLPVLIAKGWFADIITPISKVVMLCMKGINKVVGSYGIAIIVLTVIVRLLMFPLSKKQQVSMQKMQKLAPKMKAIKDKYKGNKQKQNEETIKLYKQYGVNPAAGCLPLLIQLPIFFGLFGALRYAIELRKEVFLYITDLSLPDGQSLPFLKLDFTVPVINFEMQYLNILPIVMIIVWVVQQALAPKAVDPQQRQQQKMMMVMPIIFGFLLYNYAAGLSIYMICNMFLGMVEQSIVKRVVAKHISDEVPEDISPARKAVKGRLKAGRRDSISSSAEDKPSKARSMNMPGKQSDGNSIVLKCRKCQAVYRLGEDAVVASTRTVASDIMASGGKVVGYSPYTGTDLVQHGTLNPDFKAKHDRSLAFLRNARTKGIKLSWRCAKCEETQEYPW